ETDNAELEAGGARFSTHSDTEFILRGYQPWGIETLLQRLRGMFAFAILDLKQRKVHLARDRMAERPPVYSLLDCDFAFGSLVRSVLPFLPPQQRDFSADAIDAYLAHRYIPSPATLFSHIQRLENGHRLEFDLDTRSLRKQRYWQPVKDNGDW
ncbi:asparagine synthetase B, partial [Pseudomonas sp. MWU13-2860]